MATTTFLADFLGRWLTNGTPGSTQATDSLGRAVVASNKDWMGRALTFANPSNWVTATAYSVGNRVRLSGGGILEATVAGTSGESSPTPPAVGGTVVDGTATWKRLK